MPEQAGAKVASGGLPIAFYLIAAATVALDQVTKWVVTREIGLSRRVEIIPRLLTLTHTQNPGAAFGMLPWAGGGLIVAGLVIIVILLLYGRKVAACRPLWIGLALQVGGAAGNIIDRVFRGDSLFGGMVVDFIEVRITPDYTWPTFNVADIAITVGALLIAYCIITGRDGLLGGADSPPGQDESE